MYFRVFLQTFLFTSRCLPCQLPTSINYTYFTNNTFGIVHNSTIVKKLEDYREVLVNNQKIPVLCPSIFQVIAKTSFQSFRERLLEENTQVQFINCSIITLKPGKYVQQGVLGILKISKNNIKVLHTGIFNQMPVLQLDLSYNNVTTIESEAFEGNIYLEYLVLKGNNLHSLDSQWFKNVINLRSINLAENHFTQLKNGCFNALRNNRISINLAYNNIVIIEEDVFSGFINVDSLLLQKNNLSSLPQNFFRNVTFYILHLGSNYLSKLPESFYSCDRDCNNIYINNNSFSCSSLIDIENFVNSINDCDVFKEIKVFSEKRKCKSNANF